MMNGVLQYFYDGESFNRVATNLYDIEGYRERYDNIEDTSVKNDMDTLIDLLAKYIDSDRVPFTLISEFSSRQVDLSECVFKLSMLIPKKRAGIEYWNNHVKQLDNEIAVNKLLLHLTPSGYKTIDMLSESDKQLLKNETVQKLLKDIEDSGKSFYENDSSGNSDDKVISNNSSFPTKDLDDRSCEVIGAAGGAVAGAAAGAKIGASIGIAMGPIGAIAGTIPCAVIGGIIGGLSGDKIGTEIDDSYLDCTRQN